jgi:hypothetical protein
MRGDHLFIFTSDLRVIPGQQQVSNQIHELSCHQNMTVLRQSGEYDVPGNHTPILHPLEL